MSHLLFIDDDPIIRQICKVYFSSKGYTVTVAKGGMEGLAKFKNGEYDLIVTDLMMPNCHGFEVIDQIKQMPRGNNTPIILLSADINDPDMQAYERQAFQDDTLRKPFDMPDLEKKIVDLLDEFAARF
ncbi:MAG: response regulator [Candidatus Lernaella stagnicola]|nr:response regulator [Candidatus Lernaella stagnicola]